MSTYYVNKSGSDSNGGTGPADAWLTIQHAMDTIANGDTVIVQSGVYEEEVDVGTLENWTVQADGYVVQKAPTAGSGDGWYFGDIDGTCVIDGFRILNFNNGAYLYGNKPANFKNCYLNSPYRLWGVKRNCTICENTIWDTSVDALLYWRSAWDRLFFVKNCTFTNDCLDPSGFDKTFSISIENCDIEGNLKFGSNQDLISLDYNNIRGSITYKGTTYNTLSDFQDAYPDLAPHSINENGDFNPDYTLRWSSPNIGAGEAGVDIGVRGPASYFESTDEIFEGANLTNVSRNANGDFELDSGATTGTVVSAVLDFGSDITLGNLRMKANEDYPADVIDSDVDDSGPNRANYEYRSATDADGSFAQGDATPSWNEAERGDDLSLTCRYFQVRITLRSNGVAA